MKNGLPKRTVLTLCALTALAGTAAQAGEISLFEGAGFGGRRVTLRDMSPSVNKIGSVVVNVGQWEMCIDSNYHGGYTVFGPGRYSGLGGLTNQLSSLRRVD